MNTIGNMEHQRYLQQRIRQDVEERNDALKDLSVWMDTLKVAKKPTRSDFSDSLPERKSEPLKRKDYKRAEEDATSALKICGDNNTRSKALCRRSIARFSLGKLRAALLDISTARENSCKTEPMTQEAEAMKYKIEKALADAVGRAPRRRVKVMIE